MKDLRTTRRQQRRRSVKQKNKPVNTVPYSLYKFVTEKIAYKTNQIKAKQSGLYSQVNKTDHSIFPPSFQFILQATVYIYTFKDTIRSKFKPI